MSKLKNYFQLDKMLSVFKWVVFIYAIITIGSFLVVIIDKAPSPQLNSSGLGGFFETFEYPIKITTGLIALLAILLTAMRMEQTQRQIDVLDDNNRFNNFYKHREEFEKAFNEFPLIKALLQYEQNHLKNRKIAPNKKAHLMGEMLKSKAKIFYTEWYYKDHSNFSTNFNKDILQRIDNIKTVLSSLPRIIKENGKEEINFEKTTDEMLNNIINQFPSHIAVLTSHFARIDKLEFLSGDNTVSDYGYFTNLNIVYWGLVFFGQLMNNQGMDSTEIYNFTTDYNVIRIEKDIYYV